LIWDWRKEYFWLTQATTFLYAHKQLIRKKKQKQKQNLVETAAYGMQKSIDT